MRVHEKVQEELFELQVVAEDHARRLARRRRKNDVLLDEGRAREEPLAPTPAVDSPPNRTQAAAARCGDAARAKLATLERFDQWDSQLRGSSRRSLDRGSWTLNAAAWMGHCQELDALRAALEQQLGCAVEQQGHCAGGEEAR